MADTAPGDPPPVFFAPADRQLANYFSRKTFEDSLLLGVLFQSSVLLPDIYFFISEYLFQHVHTDRRSLMEVALGQGVVVPSFRDASVVTFSDALASVDDIQGKLDSDRCEYIATRLDVAMKAESGYQPGHWPSKSVAGSYEDLLIDCLGRDDPPQLLYAWTDQQRDDLAKTWSDAQEWRTDCLEEAITRSSGGLRRGEFMNALARRAGVIAEGETLDDIAPLRDPEIELSLGKRRSLGLRAVCEVMSDAYVLNQAMQQGCRYDFPLYDLATDAVLSTKYRDELSERQPGLSANPVLEFSVELPALDVLRTIDPVTLLSIRRNCFLEFQTAFVRWCQQPTLEQRQKALEAATRGYAETLCEVVPRAALMRTAISYNSKPSIARPIAAGAADATVGALTALASQNDPKAWALILTFDAAYLILRSSVATPLRRLRARRTERRVVTLGTRSARHEGSRWEMSGDTETQGQEEAI